MKPRLIACVALAMLVIGASAFATRRVLAQGGRPSPGQQSEQERGRPGGQFSEQIDKALQAYEERLGRNLDQCRKELDQMKKELHELIDLRLNMALSLAELRAKVQMPGGGFGGGGPAGYTSYRPIFGGAGGQGSPGGGERRAEAAGLARELQQLHAQLRSEIDQQQNQIAQLADQLRGLQQQAQQQGQEARQPQAQQPGQGQGPAQSQGPGQPRGPRGGRPGPQGQPGQQPGQP